jgi:glycosyltransferase involved in cell wall biosynthesis
VIRAQTGLGASSIGIDGSDFVIAANGFSDGPSQPLARFLLERGARMVTTITHPLTADGPNEHRLHIVRNGTETTRTRRLPNRPPWTYGLDPVVPLRPPRADVWFGFNCVSTAQGLVHRSLRRVERVIHWNVDFVPDRFGHGPMTQLYDRLDAYCCTKADGRVELSEAARDGRIERYRLNEKVPVEVIPMGAWISETPQADVGRLKDRRIVFLGSLVERMGVDLLITAVGLVRSKGTPLSLEIIGGGELLDRLRRRVNDEGLQDTVLFRGFVADFSEALEILASASLAIAPYDVDPLSFSQFADPGKLKAYLSVGLPILLTNVPPNALELEREAGAEIIAPDAKHLAERIEALLDDPSTWVSRHRAAQQYARQFDWADLFADRLARLGIHA